MNIRNGIALASVVVALFGWMFSGIFIEREWRDVHLFLKHKPSFKVIFYSPLGEADRSFVPGKEGYLTPEKEAEESAYVEFVSEGDG
jgi:hypothetical protein